MKNKFSFFKLFMLSIIGFAIVSGCAGTRKTFDSTPNSSIEKMINAHNFTFVAQTVNPLRGRLINLTSLYEVSVSKDSVVSFLPYFGRSRVAPLDPSEGGIKFTSTQFSYDVTRKKNNRWDITIKPQDTHDVQEMNFSIFDNGSANLYVSNTSRDAISFNGRLR